MAEECSIVQLTTLLPIVVGGLLLGLFGLKRLNPAFWQSDRGQRLLRALPPLVGAVAGGAGLDSGSVAAGLEDVLKNVLLGAGMGMGAPMLFHAGKGTAKAVRAARARKAPKARSVPPPMPATVVAPDMPSPVQPEAPVVLERKPRKTSSGTPRGPKRAR